MTTEWVAGTCGGVCGLALSFPLDTARIRMQTAGVFADSSARGLSMVGVLRHAARADGVAALYRGFPAPALASGGMNAIAFSTFHACERLVAASKPPTGSCWAGGGGGGIDTRDDDRRARATSSSSSPPASSSAPTTASLSLVEQSACGAAAGVASSLVRGPVERLKTVMQASRRMKGVERESNELTRTRRRVAHVADELVSHATLISSTSFGHIHVSIRREHHRLFLRRTLGVQAREGRAGAAPYASSFAAARALVREGGARALFRGTGATMLREALQMMVRRRARLSARDARRGNDGVGEPLRETRAPPWALPFSALRTRTSANLF